MSQSGDKRAWIMVAVLFVVIVILFIVMIQFRDGYFLDPIDASQKALVEGWRRVVHLEFSGVELPGGGWSGFIEEPFAFSMGWDQAGTREGS